MPDVLIERDQLVNDLRGAVHEGESGLKYVPRLLLKVIETEAWRERYDTKAREVVKFESFGAFVVAEPTAGLGAPVDLIRRIVAGTEAEREVGKKLNEEVRAAGGHGGDRRSTGFQGGGTTLKKGTAEHHIARLKRDDPELAERVVEGEVSADAAAKAKGWRKPRIVLTTPQRIATHLRKHLSSDQLSELARLLTEE